VYNFSFMRVSAAILSSKCLPCALHAEDEAATHGQACLCRCFCVPCLLISYCIEQACGLASNQGICVS